MCFHVWGAAMKHNHVEGKTPEIVQVNTRKIARAAVCFLQVLGESHGTLKEINPHFTSALQKLKECRIWTFLRVKDRWWWRGGIGSFFQLCLGLGPSKGRTEGGQGEEGRVGGRVGGVKSKRKQAGSVGIAGEHGTDAE